MLYFVFIAFFTITLQSKDVNPCYNPNSSGIHGLMGNSEKENSTFSLPTNAIKAIDLLKNELRLSRNDTDIEEIKNNTLSILREVPLEFNEIFGIICKAWMPIKGGNYRITQHFSNIILNMINYLPIKGLIHSNVIEHFNILHCDAELIYDDNRYLQDIINEKILLNYDLPPLNLSFCDYEIHLRTCLESLAEECLSSIRFKMFNDDYIQKIQSAILKNDLDDCAISMEIIKTLRSIKINANYKNEIFHIFLHLFSQLQNFSTKEKSESSAHNDNKITQKLLNLYIHLVYIHKNQKMMDEKKSLCCLFREKDSPLEYLILKLMRETFDLSETELISFKNFRKYIKKNFPEDIVNLGKIIAIFLTGIDKQFINNLEKAIKWKDDVTNYIDLDLAFKIKNLEYFIFFKH